MGTTALRPGDLAEEQAALRRVATLVANGASATEVFEAVAQEVAQVLQLLNAAICRYDDEGATLTILAVSGDRPTVFQAGSSFPLDGPSLSAEVLRTGRPARRENYAGLHGTLAAAAREGGFSIVVGAPIIVDGRVWGVILTSSPDAPLPDDLGEQLGEFTALVATAIANGQAHADLAQLAEEQAALRRVATLVAEGATPAEVFEAVSTEVAQLLPASASALTRFEADDTFTVVGSWRAAHGYAVVGTRYAVEGTVAGRVLASGRPARIEDYAAEPGEAARRAVEMGWSSSVGAPVTVEGRLWGVLSVLSAREMPLPPGTEPRLAGFSELVATAIANAESREKLARLAEEQAALRRVATLVAVGAEPAEVFQAVSVEIGQLIPADAAGLARYEPDGTITVLGIWTRSGGFHLRIGDRISPDARTTARMVLDTGRPARLDGPGPIAGRTAGVAGEPEWTSRVGAPIIVQSRVWGVVVVLTDDEPLPDDTEARVMQFTELLATGIANAESRAELDESRARIVATADATRRRIERDLHDGAQQKLVSLALELRAAEENTPVELDEHRAELAHVAEGLTGVLDGLREIALGLHPAILAEGGLGPALKTLANRSPIPVTLDVRAEGRLTESTEVAAYYVVSEALTNAAKHARASTVRVHVDLDGPLLRVSVEDDGVGGADKSRGSGLLGLKDRAEAIGGRIFLESLPGKGTSLTAELPLIERSG